MKPLLLLDIDGVLCPFGGDDAAKPIPHHEYAWYFPQHELWLKELRQEYDMAWASMWMNDANTVMAPLYDLDPMPFVVFNKLPLGRRTFKLEAVEEFVEDRPFAWVEDDLFEDAHEWAEERNESIPTLLVHTNPSVGLDEDAMDELRSFANQINQGAPSDFQRST